MAFESIVKEGNFYQTSTGDYGFRLLTGTEVSIAGESFRAIQVISDTAQLVATSVRKDSINDTLVISKGTVIFGKFTEITMTSGKVIAYLAS